MTHPTLPPSSPPPPDAPQPDAHASDALPSAALLALRVLHATRRWVVVDKPAGVLSVPGRGPDKAACVVSRVRELFPHADGPMIVHRLDMDTSGLLVVALDAPTQALLSRQFEERFVEKTYVAVLDADIAAPHDVTPAPHAAPDLLPHGEIFLPMRLDVDARPYQIIDFAQGRDALTRWRLLARQPAPGDPRPLRRPDGTPIPAGTTLARVEFTPVTGRTHQLRVHAAAPRTLTTPDGRTVPGGLGAAIVGDVLYADGLARVPVARVALTARDSSSSAVAHGAAPSSPARRVRTGATPDDDEVLPHPRHQRLLLHASMLSFIDPDTRTRVRFESPAPF